MFPWLESRTIEYSDGTGNKITYDITEDGFTEAYKIKRGFENLVGKFKNDRPVSLVKPAPGGRLRGEAAYTQRETTRSLSKKTTPKVVQDAKNKLSAVAHVASPHKVALLAGIFSAGVADRGSWQAKFLKQGNKHLDAKVNEIVKELTALQEKGLYNLQEDAASRGIPTEQASIPVMARIHAEQRLATANEGKLRSLYDGVSRQGDVFYYGYTAIDNSSRLLISNTELNYQLDKLSRFMVDGAKPVGVKKGSGDPNEIGFLTVIGRSLIEGADKMPREEIVRRTREAIKSGEWDRPAADLLAYTQANTGWIGQANNALPNVEQSLSEIPLPDPLTSPALQEFFANADRDDIPWMLDALHEVARYKNASDGTTLLTRVKAEADGIQNGAVIQGYQMGEEGILEKGGILYEGDQAIIGEDLRSYVWGQFGNTIESSGVIPQERRVAWHNLLGSMKKNGKVKEAIKIPMMTTIYGKEAKFHRDHVEKFVRENPEIVEEYAGAMDLDFEEATTEFTKEMSGVIEDGLNNALQGVLEHSNIMKRVGRAFNIVNRIATVRGANEWLVQSGGWDIQDVDPIPISLGTALGSRQIYVTAKPRTVSAVAAASPKDIAGRPGEKTAPGSGSKLRNQLKVNGTQNIDATIAQETVNAMPNDAFMMQIYDAFIGDSASFRPLVKTANQKFIEVNRKYNMLREEANAFKALKNHVNTIVAQHKKDGLKMDIGLSGKYPMMTEFFDKFSGTVSADLTEAQSAVVRSGMSRIRTSALQMGWKKNAESNLVDPDKFQQMFNLVIGPEVLNVDNELSKLLSKVGARRKAIRNREREQEERFGEDHVLQYG